MIRVKKTTFRTTKADLDWLFFCNRESARVWNDCLSHAKEYHKQNGRWIDRKERGPVCKTNA